MAMFGKSRLHANSTNEFAASMKDGAADLSKNKCKIKPR
jgi:hypothetical protein